MGPVRLDIPTFASKSLGRLVTERGEIKLECLGVLTTKLTTYETDNGGQHGTTAERTRGSDVRQCISADVYGPRFKDRKSCRFQNRKLQSGGERVIEGRESSLSAG